MSKNAKKCQFPSISVKKCQRSSNGGEVASVADDLVPLYLKKINLNLN